MNTPSSRHVRFNRRTIADPAVVESVVASMVVLVLSGGLSLVCSWLWVWRWALFRPTSPDLKSGVILVCGHRLIDNRPSNDYALRLTRAAGLLETQPHGRLILLGGGEPSEASAGREWLLANSNINAAMIELEENSTDSLENLRHARDLIRTGEHVLLLSSRYHLGRLRLFSRQLGLNADLVAAEPEFRPSWRNFGLMAMESVFVCWFVAGRLWAQMARREHLLEKIC